MPSKHILVLQTPKQHSYTNPAVELNPKAVTVWIEELPLLNPVSTLKQLQDAVSALNQQETPVKTRLRLLEVYRSAVIRLFPGCEPEEIRHLNINRARRDEVKTGMTGFLEAMADGYKIIVKQENRAKQKPKKASVLLLCLYRTMEMLALGLLHAYRNYHATPGFIFMELHQVYLYAEDHKVLDTPIVHEKKAVYGTLAELYKRTMLLSTTDPFHLAEGAATKLFYLIGDFLEPCTIDTTLPLDATQGSDCYIIDLDGDSPPQGINSYEAGEFIRILNTREFTVALKNKIAALRSSDSVSRRQQAELQLLKNMEPQTSVVQKREAERISSDRSSLGGFGIGIVHYLLSLDSPELTSITEQGACTLPVPSEDGAIPMLEEWNIGNESKTGYLLARSSPPETEIHIGDIGCLLTSTRGRTRAHLTLFAVRWIKHFDNRRTETGVEILPGEAFPVDCRIEEMSLEETDACPAIFLSSVPILNIPATLLTPKHIYQRGRRLGISTREKTLHIEAGFLAQDSSSFDRFEFKTISQS